MRNLLIKRIKWLLRVVCALGAALFILTEAVPVFIGVLFAFLLMFAMSVWHADKINPALLDKTFAGMLMAFGAVTVMPAVVGLGIVYWVNTPRVEFWREFRALL